MLSTKCPHPPEGCKISKAPLFSKECKFLGGRKLSPSKTKLGHSYRNTGLLTQRQLNLNEPIGIFWRVRVMGEREDACSMIKKTNERTNERTEINFVLYFFNSKNVIFLQVTHLFFIFSRSRLKLKHETKLQKVKFKHLSLQCD